MRIHYDLDRRIDDDDTNDDADADGWGREAGVWHTPSKLEDKRGYGAVDGFPP